MIRKNPSLSISPMSPVRNQPSSVNASRRCVRLVVIADHHTGAACLDLAVRRDPNLDITYGFSDSSESAALRIVRRDDRRGFGQAVALIDRYSRSGKNQINIIGQRRSARNTRTKAAAEKISQLPIDQLVRQRMFDLTSINGTRSCRRRDSVQIPSPPRSPSQKYFP